MTRDAEPAADSLVSPRAKRRTRAALTLIAVATAALAGVAVATNHATRHDYARTIDRLAETRIEGSTARQTAEHDEAEYKKRQHARATRAKEQNSKLRSSASWKRYRALDRTLGIEGARTLDKQDATTTMHDAVVELRTEYQTEQPWYPRGFTEWEDGLAYQFLGGCESYGGYCWRYAVVARDGCPTSLYVEAKILSGSTNVGWTNDTAQLDVGETAVLEFQSYEQGYGTLAASISEMNCY